MASKFCMSAPRCLIENQDRRLHVCQDALELLSKIDQPVVVVAIVGLYRTGKSYLMNKLAGKNKGFPLGSTVQSMTKGIWMWCVPHPSRPKQTLVLLDTEGLGDVEKGDSQNDSWIFALAVLLSSTLVYNSLGTIDQHAMEQLHYVTELTEQIKAKSAFGDDAEDSAEFVRFFPTFVWALRDFTLLLELNGEPITEDEYLENSLKLRKGNSHEAQMHNLPRKCIRTFFPKRKCFVFDRPASRKNLPKLEFMTESELEPEFVEQAAMFCRYIFRTSEPKTIPGGHVVNGHMLASLLVTYVDTIRSGKVPCMENAVLALAEIENSTAVRDAVARYVELMEQKLKLPTETVEELLRVHGSCEEDALQVFMAKAFKDDNHQYQVEFMKNLNQKREEYFQKNEQVSSKRCWELLQSISQELEGNIKNGIYSQRGGHKQFVNDLKTLEQQYHQAPGKGVMAKEVLEKFLKEKENTGRTILQSDEALTQKEKEMAEATARAEAAEREKEIQKQQQAILEQKMEDQRRSYETNLQQLQQKMEVEREKILNEQERVINAKLQEQKKLLDEGFQKEANKMREEIQQLRHEAENVKKPSFWERAADVFLGAVSAVLPGVLGKGLGGVLSGFKRR